MSSILSNHNRIILAVWVAAAVLLVATAGILALMRAEGAETRIETRIAAFTSHSSAQPGATAAESVRSFLAVQIPDSDEILAGLIDDEVVRVERTGRGFTVGDPLYQAITTGTGAENPNGLDTDSLDTDYLQNVRHTSVAVLDAQGGTATLVSAVDTSAERQRDRTLLALITVVEVLLAAGLTVLIKSPRSDPPEEPSPEPEAAGHEPEGAPPPDYEEAPPVEPQQRARHKNGGLTLRDIVAGP